MRPSAPRYGVAMPEWTKDWRPLTVGEAREYLDTHDLDGDHDILAACEALVDARPHLTGTIKPSAEQLEERGAD